MALRKQQPDKGRRRALLWATVDHADAERLVSRHPDPAIRRLPDAEAAAPLGALLWHELPRIEAAAGTRKGREHRQPSGAPDPVAYWRRRYRAALKHEWWSLLKQIPNLWRVLIDLSASAIEDLAVLLGFEMVAHMAAAQPTSHVRQLLAPLDEQDRGRVAARIEQLDGDAVPGQVTERWRRLYESVSPRRGGRRLMRWLSLTLLADMMSKRFTPRLRAAGARHCRSDLFNVLITSRRRPMLDAEHIGAVEAVVLELCGRVKPGDETSDAQ